MAHSRSNYIMDTDMLFRASGSVAITANGVSNSLAVSLDKLTGARGDQRDKLGAHNYKAIINVEALQLNEVATIVLSAPMAVGSEFIVDDGTNAADTLTSNTDWTSFISIAADIAALVVAINGSTAAGLVAKDDGVDTIYIENTLTTQGVITKTVDVGTLATLTDFATGVFDESYQMQAEVGPAGFGTSAIVGDIPSILAIGQYVMILDAGTVEKLDSDHVDIRLVLTAVDGGVDTASFTYNAWLI